MLSIFLTELGKNKDFLVSNTAALVSNQSEVRSGQNRIISEKGVALASVSIWLMSVPDTVLILTAKIACDSKIIVRT